MSPPLPNNKVNTRSSSEMKTIIIDVLSSNEFKQNFSDYICEHIANILRNCEADKLTEANHKIAVLTEENSRLRISLNNVQQQFNNIKLVKDKLEERLESIKVAHQSTSKQSIKTAVLVKTDATNEQVQHVNVADTAKKFSDLAKVSNIQKPSVPSTEKAGSSSKTTQRPQPRNTIGTLHQWTS